MKKVSDNNRRGQLIKIKNTEQDKQIIQWKRSETQKP